VPSKTPLSRQGYRTANWKRPVLFALSLLFLTGAIGGAYAQLRFAWTNDRIWWVIPIFAALGVYGIAVTLFGSDERVANTLGGL
jgi:hypothetical protein